MHIHTWLVHGAEIIHLSRSEGLPWWKKIPIHQFIPRLIGCSWPMIIGPLYPPLLLTCAWQISLSSWHHSPLPLSMDIIFDWFPGWVHHSLWSLMIKLLIISWWLCCFLSSSIVTFTSSASFDFLLSDVHWEIWMGLNIFFFHKPRPLFPLLCPWIYICSFLHIIELWVCIYFAFSH